MKLEILPLTYADWPAVRAIYEQGIATGNATFEESAPKWERWDAAHLPHSRLVACEGDEVVAWAALSSVSSRCVYAGVAEVSIYVAARSRGRGIGLALLTALIESSECENIWTLQAGIFPENTASLDLFRKAGFRVLGTRERVGRMDGRWRDVVLMERRSQVAGV
jgi:L-amino acid N-acyltransferase YncA